VTRTIATRPEGSLKLSTFAVVKVCGVPVLASAQILDFIAMIKNPRFPKLQATVSPPEFPGGY